MPHTHRHEHPYILEHTLHIHVPPHTHTHTKEMIMEPLTRGPKVPEHSHGAKLPGNSVKTVT